MAARKATNAITITFEVPGKPEKDVRDFIRTVLTNDLLLRGRKREEAPEGAGSWGHLIAAFADLDMKDANALVPFIRVLANEEKGNVDMPKAVKQAAAPAPASDAVSAELAEMRAYMLDMGNAVAMITKHIAGEED